MTLEEDINSAVETMKRGGIILYPTDTVWGIGCDATCEDAVRRIFALKRRADSKAMISLVGSEEMLAQYAGEPTAEIAGFLRSDRPTTIIYGSVEGLTPALLGEEGSAALRLTREEYSSQLCRRLGRPVVSTSANISGEPAAATFAQISPEILAGVDYTAAYRRDDGQPARPSRIIMAVNGQPLKIIRE